MRKFTAVISIAVLTAFLTGMSEAKDMTGLKGVGWFDQNAPIGGILWVSPKIGVTAGVGFNSPDDGNDATDEETQINLAGAVPIVLMGSDNTNFMFRPGILYSSNPPGYDSSISIRADLAVEFWLGSRASVLAGHGLEFMSNSPAVGDSQTHIGSRAISVTDIGFYFYFMN